MKQAPKSQKILTADDMIKLMDDMLKNAQEAQEFINAAIQVSPSAKEIQLNVNTIFTKHNNEHETILRKQQTNLQKTVKQVPNLQATLNKTTSNLQKTESNKKSLAMQGKVLKNQLATSNSQASVYTETTNDKIKTIQEAIEKSKKLIDNQRNNKKEVLNEISKEFKKVKQIHQDLFDFLQKLNKASKKIEQSSDLKQNSTKKETFFNKVIKNMPSIHYLFNKKPANNSNPQTTQQTTNILSTYLEKNHQNKLSNR